MVINNDRAIEPTTFEHQIDAVALRPANQTAIMLAQRFAQILAERRFPRLADAQPTLLRLYPFFHHLVVTHALEDGAAELQTDDMRVRFTLEYERTEPDKNLLLPPMDYLGALSTEDTVTLKFCLNTSPAIIEARFSSLLSAINAAGVLKVLLLNKDCAGCTDPEPITRDRTGVQSAASISPVGMRAETEPAAQAALPGGPLPQRAIESKREEN